MRSPPSADSRRNAPPSTRSFANAETGVSRSARRSRMTGTSSMVFGAVTATFALPSVADRDLPLPPRKQIALARSRDEGSWCHPIVPPHRCGDLSLPHQGAPVGNGGLPAAANRSPFAAASRGSHSNRARRPGSHRLRFASRSARPTRSRSNDAAGHRTEMAVFWPSPASSLGSAGPVRTVDG